MSLFNDAIGDLWDLLARFSGNITTAGFSRGDDVTFQGQDMKIVRVGAKRLRCEWSAGGQVRREWFGSIQVQKGSRITQIHNALRSQESPDARKWRDIQEGRFR